MEIERNYENILMDMAVKILVELNLPDDQRKVTQSYKNLYNSAIELYREKKWDEALVKFIMAKNY